MRHGDSLRLHRMVLVIVVLADVFVEKIRHFLATHWIFVEADYMISL